MSSSTSHSIAVSRLSKPKSSSSNTISPTFFDSEVWIIAFSIASAITTAILAIQYKLGYILFYADGFFTVTEGVVLLVGISIVVLLAFEKVPVRMSEMEKVVENEKTGSGEATVNTTANTTLPTTDLPFSEKPKQPTAHNMSPLEVEEVNVSAINPLPPSSTQTTSQNSNMKSNTGKLAVHVMKRTHRAKKRSLLGQPRRLRYDLSYDPLPSTTVNPVETSGEIPKV